MNDPARPQAEIVSRHTGAAPRTKVQEKLLIG
jgi:hypothetical protein